MQSETIGELAEALAQVQAALPVVHKGNRATVPTKSGGSYSYTYADLSDVTAAALPLLSQHGLAFTCSPRSGERGWELSGMLSHSSGEWIAGALPLNGSTPQELGSSITYMRRYLLGALTGLVTDDDDDGNTAQRAARKPQQSAKDRAWHRALEVNKGDRDAAMDDLAGFCQKRGTTPEQAGGDVWIAYLNGEA